MKKLLAWTLVLVMCFSLLGVTAAAAELPFTDVTSSAYYYEPVAWAVDMGVTTGTSATTFSPDNTCTRNQVVTFLWRAMGEPEPTSSENPFVDVKEADYFYKAVLWAVERKITNGVDATHFGPENSCTRAQVATFLWRTVGSVAPKSDECPFTDVVKGEYYYDAVLWAVEMGVTTGTSATTFAPNDTCTRGQIVTFLYRALKDGIECEHAYDHGCDQNCNLCGATRETKHEYKENNYSNPGPCIHCDHPYISIVGDITLNKTHVEVGDTFKAKIQVTGGEEPYTVTWYYYKDGKDTVIKGASGLNPEITATAEMFDDNGMTEIYCSVADAEGHPTSPMSRVQLRMLGELSVTLTARDGGLLWNVPSYYANTLDVEIGDAVAVGASADATYKWEWSRDKKTWHEESTVKADGFSVAQYSDTAADTVAVVATKEALADFPLYVRVTVSDGFDRTATSNVVVFYREVEATNITTMTFADGSRGFWMNHIGGNGEYTYEWFYLDSNDVNKGFETLLMEVDDNNKELQLTKSQYEMLIKYADALYCKVTSADHTVNCTFTVA